MIRRHWWACLTPGGPNRELPHPLPEDFPKRFNESCIRYDVAKDKGVTPDHESNRFRITVDISRQQAYLWQDGKIEFETRISSGRKSHPAPQGRFVVTDKCRKWTSTLSDSPRPFFLRLSCGDFGLPAGALPGYPASHGCIRLPEKSARKLFASVPVGTVVEIE